MEELAEIAKLLSENPAAEWIAENPLEASTYALSATGATGFVRAFQGARNTAAKYGKALEERDTQRFNELQEEYLEVLDELSEDGSFRKVISRPYKDGEIFGHLYGKSIWYSSDYDLESSRFST